MSNECSYNNNYNRPKERLRISHIVILAMTFVGVTSFWIAEFLASALGTTGLSALIGGTTLFAGITVGVLLSYFIFPMVVFLSGIFIIYIDIRFSKMALTSEGLSWWQSFNFNDFFNGPVFQEKPSIGPPESETTLPSSAIASSPITKEHKALPTSPEGQRKFEIEQSLISSFIKKRYITFQAGILSIHIQNTQNFLRDMNSEAIQALCTYAQTESLHELRLILPRISQNLVYQEVTTEIVKHLSKSGAHFRALSIDIEPPRREVQYLSDYSRETAAALAKHGVHLSSIQVRANDKGAIAFVEACEKLPNLTSITIQPIEYWEEDTESRVFSLMAARNQNGSYAEANKYQYKPKKILCGFGEEATLTPEEENFIFTTFNRVVRSVMSGRKHLSDFENPSEVPPAFPMPYGNCILYTHVTCSEAASKFPGAIGLWLNLKSFSSFGLYTGKAPGVHQMPVIYFNGKFYFFDFSNFSSSEGTVYISPLIFKIIKEDICETNVETMRIVDLYFLGERKSLWEMKGGPKNVLNYLTLGDHKKLIDYVTQIVKPGVKPNSAFDIKPNLAKKSGELPEPMTEENVAQPSDLSCSPPSDSSDWPLKYSPSFHHRKLCDPSSVVTAFTAAASR